MPSQEGSKFATGCGQPSELSQHAPATDLGEKQESRRAGRKGANCVQNNIQGKEMDLKKKRKKKDTSHIGFNLTGSIYQSLNSIKNTNIAVMSVPLSKLT